MRRAAAARLTAEPFATDGHVELRFEDGYLSSEAEEVCVPIERVQLEQVRCRCIACSHQDTAKTTHFAMGAGTATVRSADVTQQERATFLDFNRAGVAIIEVVSDPAMRTPEQAGAYVRKLRDLLRCVGASDGNMNEGSLRCDANVSIHRIGEPFGPRCELKNLNSVKFMVHALTQEIARQYDSHERGVAVVQESRGFDEANGITYSMRSKEDAVDYRYMPDANLPPLRAHHEYVEHIRAALPELPDDRHDRLRRDYGLSVRDVNVLARLNAEDDAPVAGAPANVDAVSFFEDVVRMGTDAQTAVNWCVVTRGIADVQDDERTRAQSERSRPPLRAEPGPAGCAA